MPLNVIVGIISKKELYTNAMCCQYYNDMGLCAFEWQ